MENTRFIEIDGQQISVSEEVYHAYKRPLWAERKRQERISRCRNECGVRCAEDCRTCNQPRTGTVLSLDQFASDGLEIADSIDLAELVADRLLLEQLATAIARLEPDDQKLIQVLFYDERTLREVAQDMGVCYQAVFKRKQKVLAKLRYFLESK